MTSKLEQEFFKVFGIKPKRQCYYSDTHCKNHCNKDCVNFYMKPKYPEITSDTLLEMVCIYNNNVYENEKITPSNINTLKEDVLHWIINDFEGNEKFKYQIQELFKEED